MLKNVYLFQQFKTIAFEYLFLIHINQISCVLKLPWNQL